MSKKIAWIKSKESQKSLDSVEFDGQKIEVERYMNVEKQRILINTFMQIYFENEERNYISAQYGNIIAVLDLMTNVDIENEFNIELFIASGLWEKIKRNIDNYPQFEMALKDALEYEKNKKDNIAYVVQSFLMQINPLLKKISEFDFSQEGLDNINNIIKNFSKELENTPVGAIMKESVK